MSEQRKITVERDNPIWQEYDREVCIELWHNPNQTTSLRLSRDEAWNLRDELNEFLKEVPQMTRTRASAKSAGSSFERLIADYLATEIDDRIDRRVKTGAADKGDIGGLRHHGHRLAVECKNHAAMNLAGWVAEAQAEAVNDGALMGFVVHKRRGKGKAGDQYVTLVLSDLVKLLKATY